MARWPLGALAGSVPVSLNTGRVASVPLRVSVGGWCAVEGVGRRPAIGVLLRVSAGGRCAPQVPFQTVTVRHGAHLVINVARCRRGVIVPVTVTLIGLTLNHA